MRSFLWFCCAAYSIASPIADAVAATPTVHIRNGTVIGSTSDSIDTFNGIPFAQPPTGTLRLKPPKTITSKFGTLTATAAPKSCPQFIASVPQTGLLGDLVNQVEQLPFFQNPTASEDCLTLDVIRPNSATSTSKLPVLVYIFGGGFEAGSSTLFSGTGVVQKSMQLNHDIIWVAMNYRVGGFGFLAGKELQRDGSTNLGLRDQRLALQWVQENIAAFGGDPKKVTIWGESAGAISVFDQTLINNGDHTFNGKPLFRAGMMNSGSVVPARTVSSGKAQAVYDTVVEHGGCANAADTLACLRALPFAKFQAAVSSVPGIFNYQSLDLAYVPRPDATDGFFSQSPDTALSNGHFAKVPIIIGDQEDEGTLFALTTANVTTPDELITYVADYYPGVARNIIADIVNAYPADPAAGSPYNTGILYNIYPEFKRLAAIQGDLTFTLSRRLYLSKVSQVVKSYSYLATYLQGTPLLGTFHGSDLLLDQLPLPDIARDSILAYYISFVYYLDPNKIIKPTAYPTWPQWNSTRPTLINFESTKVSYLADDFRSAQYEVLINKGSALRI